MHQCEQKLHNTNIASLALRIAVAFIFISAGWFKVTNMEIVVGMFSGMGFSAFFAYLVGYIELIGGILVLIGLYTRYASILLAIIMAVATIKVHVPKGDYELTTVLFLVLVALVTLGAGKYAVSRWCKCSSCTTGKEGAVSTSENK